MTASRPFGPPPSLEEFEVLAHNAFVRIPAPLRRMAEGVAILVHDFPDEDTLEELGIESPFDLLGLYDGLSLDLKSVSDAPEDIDRILLYRRPILDYWCETGEGLEDIVRNTLIHEIGHHFGFSDEDMHRLESEVE